MSIDQDGMQSDNQKPTGPAPLQRYPVAWFGIGYTDSVRGALELSDRRLLSWSWDDTLRLWSSKEFVRRVLL